jgi:hypothetical protein
MTTHYGLTEALASERARGLVEDNSWEMRA